MTKRQELEEEVRILRNAYRLAHDANDEEEMKNVVAQGLIIRRKLENLCYVCHNEERSFNEYYCSPECNDKLYPPETVRPGSTEGFKRKLEDWRRKQK